MQNIYNIKYEMKKKNSMVYTRGYNLHILRIRLDKYCTCENIEKEGTLLCREWTQDNGVR